MIKFIRDKFFNTKKNKILVNNNSKLLQNKNAEITNCNISLFNSTLEISDFAVLKDLNITLINGKMTVGEKAILEGTIGIRPEIHINKGQLKIGAYSKIRSSITIRFDGICDIGNYTSINEGSELRCDEKITIGSFNMISYNSQINDTNTHTVLPVEERRKLTIKEYPWIGNEYKRPPTKPVKIGNDCWLGKGVTILKGVNIGDSAIIATQSVVTIDVPEFYLAAGNPAKLVKKYNPD